MAQCDEGRALNRLRINRGLERGNGPGRKHGAIDGSSVRKRERSRVTAKAEAKIIVEYMMENNMIPKEGYAKEAIQTAVELMRETEIHPRDKLAAAKVVLEYTLAKPATETTVNVKSAEDFLAEIAKDAGISG